MLIEISQKRMQEVGALMYEAFVMARSSRRLSVKELIDEGLITYRNKLYAV